MDEKDRDEIERIFVSTMKAIFKPVYNDHDNFKKNLEHQIRCAIEKASEVDPNKTCHDGHNYSIMDGVMFCSKCGGVEIVADLVAEKRRKSGEKAHVGLRSMTADELARAGASPETLRKHQS